MNALLSWILLVLPKKHKIWGIQEWCPEVNQDNRKKETEKILAWLWKGSQPYDITYSV